MAKKKKILFVLLALFLLFFLIFLGYDKWPSQNWREYRSLVKLWPRLQRGKIESIRFCYAPDSEIIKSEEESFFREIAETYGFRTRDENDVKSWRVIFEVPKENLPEFILLIDKAMKTAKPSWPLVGPIKPMIWLERMLIVTNKSKYIVSHVEAYISNVDNSRVFGDEWKSYELGEYLKKCGFPIPDANQPEQKLSE